MLNHLEQVAQRLGFELVIEEHECQWVVTENIADAYAFELPIIIGDTEATAIAWLEKYLSETVGV